MIKSGTRIIKKGNAIPSNVDTIRQDYLFVFAGESNSTGQALNSNALASELDENANVKIFKSYSQGAINLNIGAGNNDPYNADTHGWELQLSNKADNGDFNGRQVYVCKTGWPGTVAAQWVTGSTHWNNARVKILNCLQWLRENSGKYSQTYVFFSLGINDAIAQTNTVDFKNDLKEYLGNIHAILPNAPIIATKIFTDDSYYIGINTILTEVESELSYFSLIEITGASVEPLSPSHWDYDGMKLLCDRLITETGL